MNGWICGRVHGKLDLFAPNVSVFGGVMWSG